MANSVNRRGPKHRWSVDDRIILCLLDRLYTWKQQKDHIVAVWSHINQEQLIHEGFPDGKVNPHLFGAQRHDCKIGKTGSDIWKRVMRPTLTEAKAVFATQMEMIEAAERELIRGRQATAMTARADEWSNSSEGDQEADSLLHDENVHIENLIRDSDAAEQSTQQRKVSTEAESVNELLRRPLARPYLRSQHIIGNYTVRCPVLLFRGFESAHGLRARRFVQTVSPTTAPPQFSSAQYRAEVHPHLERTVPYNSPFLSLAQNPINALKWVGREDRDLAILLLQDVGEDALARYGDVGAAYPYLANAIIRQHDLNDLPGQYVGRGEVSYLILGHERLADVRSVPRLGLY